MTKALIVTAVAALALAACGEDASKGAPKTGASTPSTTPPPASSTPPAPADAKKDMKK